MGGMISRETLSVRGRETTVFRAGSGPALVWLHGPRGVRGHDPFVSKLAATHSVIAPLSPGFADVAELDDIDDAHDLALYYDDVFDALQLHGVTLVGHSFGALAAAEYAAHYPRRVDRLVLISPLGIWRDEEPVPDLFGVPYMALDKLLWKDGKASGPMADPADDPADPLDRQIEVSHALTTVAKFLWPIPDHNLRRRLPRITARTLIVAGAKDPFVPAGYVGAFAAGIAGSRTATIAGAGHMAPYEQLEEATRLVEDFVGVPEPAF